MTSNYGLPTEVTARSLFNKVKAHLEAQGAPCKDAEGKCAYRGGAAGTSACAVGCLITDDQAREATWDFSLWLYLGVEELLVDHAPTPAWKAWAAQMSPHSSLLVDLQAVHDDPHGFLRAHTMQGSTKGLSYMEAVDKCFRFLEATLEFTEIAHS